MSTTESLIRPFCVFCHVPVEPAQPLEPCSAPVCGECYEKHKPSTPGETIKIAWLV